MCYPVFPTCIFYHLLLSLILSHWWWLMLLNLFTLTIDLAVTSTCPSNLPEPRCHMAWTMMDKSQLVPNLYRSWLNDWMQEMDWIMLNLWLCQHLPAFLEKYMTMFSMPGTSFYHALTMRVACFVTHAVLVMNGEGNQPRTARFAPPPHLRSGPCERSQQALRSCSHPAIQCGSGGVSERLAACTGAEKM